MWSFFDKKPMLDDDTMQQLAMAAGTGVDAQPQPKTDTELAADVQKRAIQDQRDANTQSQVKTEAAKTQLQTDADLKKEDHKNIWERTKDEIKDMTLFDLIPMVTGALAGGMALGPLGALVGAGAGQVKGRQIKTQETAAANGLNDPRLALDAWYKDQMINLDRAREARAQEEAGQNKYFFDYMKGFMTPSGGSPSPAPGTPAPPPKPSFQIPTIKV